MEHKVRLIITCVMERVYSVRSATVDDHANLPLSHKKLTHGASLTGLFTFYRLHQQPDGLIRVVWFKGSDELPPACYGCSTKKSTFSVTFTPTSHLAFIRNTPNSPGPLNTEPPCCPSLSPEYSPERRH